MSVKPFCSFADKRVKALTIFAIETVISGAKPLVSSMIDSAFHPCKVKQMNIETSWGLVSKK